MSYQEQLAKAKRKGTAKSLMVDIHTWKEPGDELVGKVMEVKPFEGGKFDSTCMKYIMDTDNGMITTILGAAADKQFEGKDVTGKVLWITYKGKTDLEGGKQCNRFDIREL